MATLRAHFKDVQDLSWAPDSSAFISGSVENECILWDVGGKRGAGRLRDHSHYVQGVAWDPLNQMLATQSVDRCAGPGAGAVGCAGAAALALWAVLGSGLAEG